jgi:hypothetical protein
MVADRLILHLGDSKTGSTSIQRTLRASRAALSDAGVLFPDPGRHDNHQLVFPHLHGVLPDDPVQLESLGGDGALGRAAALWDALRLRVEDESPRTVVLSCENQFRAYDADALDRMSRLAPQVARRVEVFAYLRSPASFFLSYAQQSIKKRPEFRVLSPSRYRDVLQPLDDHGPGPVSVVRFGRDVLRDGDAVTDFCARLLPEVDRAGLVRGNGEENATVSPEAMVLLQDIFRRTRALPRGYENDRKALRKIVMATDPHVPGQARPRLHEAVRHAVETRCTDLEWLADRFGVAFPDLGPRDMQPAEAARIHDGLRDVTDLCPVDPERVEALWDAVTREATLARGPLRRLGRALGL